ncbi:uncharacterized protein LOC120251277 [Dioscorea cayenensis subsp. rotundata]|uniref:Uncharacterized protein LOC120251277 n=1 Tax=Dioscorea cayennensis subsp. rotundata TaxID=55577 RepID=A0AB40AL46_DIOCR|nr:uncharacterized protein LOC120251277 [Dioscorea cayenensis subsp. rotundata]
MNRDRSWMYCRKDGASFINDEFVKGVEEFISFAYSQTTIVSGDSIKCPCHRCENSMFQIADMVRKHLYYNGFMIGYTSWTSHGEHEIGQSSRYGDEHIHTMPQIEARNPYAQMMMDFISPTFNIPRYHDTGSSFMEEEPNPKASTFYSLLNDADEPLYEGCTKYSKLSALSQLLNLKSDFNMSEACFDRLMVMIKYMLPQDECLPNNFYRTKQKMKSLGMGYEKIDVCQNNCMLFYKEAAKLDHCAMCGHPRYKMRQLGKSKKGKQKQIPCKILRYLPLIPRLQRLYMSAKTAENMIWHVTNKSTDGVLRHPVDGEAWQHFDQMYPSFAQESRNVRLGLCADGFSPFGPAAKPYSIWPVMLVVYNLPPWMCMNQSYIFLNMVIPRKKSPGQNIDVFLRPLIDELKQLWNDGILTYDAFKKQNFTMRASLLWTINDFPAYGMLSGLSTHGTLSCPY